MNLKKIAYFVSGVMFFAGKGVSSSENVHAKDSMDVLSHSISIEENRIIKQSLGGSVRFTLPDLNMQKSDVLHLNVYGDADDVIQVHFYYTNSNGDMASSIIGGFGGTILDSNGQKVVDFTAPNDLSYLTVKILYNKSEPTYTYEVDYKSSVISNDATTTTTTTAATTTTTTIETTTTTTASTTKITTTTGTTVSVPMNESTIVYHNAEKDSISFDVKQNTYNNNYSYYLFGNLDYLQELEDQYGNIYAVIGQEDTVSLIPKDSEKDVVVFSKPGYTFGAAIIDDQDYIYLLWGKDLEDIETDEDNVQLCQYSLDGKLESICLLSSKGTSSTIPFDGGNANLAYNDGKLAVLFDTEWKSGHQGSEFFLFDVNTKNIELYDTNTCSHSFGVSMIPTDNGFVSIQRGDCYERGIVLQEIINNQSRIFEQIAYHISGIYNEEGQHQNATYTLMGGIAVNSETYAIAGKSERFYASNHYAEYRTGIYDVFVRIVARDPEDSLPLAGVDRVDELTGNVADKNVIWLTECDDLTKAGSVKVVSLSGNRYCVLWETFKNNSFDHISYVIIDQYGNQLQNETSIFNARLSDTSIQPIVQDEVLTWAVADKDNGTINWYTVDLNQKITASSRIIGDINLDGSVTVSDAVILQKYLLCSCTLKEEQWEAADLMEDGNINIFDLAVLKCILLQSAEKLKGI